MKAGRESATEATHVRPGKHFGWDEGEPDWYASIGSAANVLPAAATAASGDTLTSFWIPCAQYSSYGRSRIHAR